MNEQAAREYAVAIGDKLAQALTGKNLELTALQIVPGERPDKFVIRGMAHRPIAMQDKAFATEIDGNLDRMSESNVNAFIDFIVPKIVKEFFGE